MPTLMFLNTWGGCLQESLLPFIESKRDEIDVFCLTETFRCADEQVPDRQDPVDLGHRRFPLHVRTYDKIRERICASHDGYFASQMYRHFHDLEETNLPVQYGIAMFVRRELPVIDLRSGMLIRAYSMKNDGQPAARTMQSLCVRHDDQSYVVAHFHGLWTHSGKGDTEERLQQSAAVVQRLVAQVEHEEALTGVRPKVVLGGDFNLRSDTCAFEMLLNGKMFGPSGGINLNNEYQVCNTRTKHYPAHKPSREADFVLVSRDVEVQKYEVPEEPVVSDHRPLIVTCS